MIKTKEIMKRILKLLDNDAEKTYKIGKLIIELQEDNQMKIIDHIKNHADKVKEIVKDDLMATTKELEEWREENDSEF